MSSIGTRIRERRKAAELNQTEAAKRIEIDQSTLSDIERGAGFSAEVLMRICQALDTTPEYIMRGESVDATEAEVLAVFRALKAESRTSMLAMARGLAQATPKLKGIPKSGESSPSRGSSGQSKKAA